MLARASVRELEEATGNGQDGEAGRIGWEGGSPHEARGPASQGQVREPVLRRRAVAGAGEGSVTGVSPKC